MIKLLLLFSLFLFNSTLSAEITQPQDTQKYYYALGEGASLSKAKENALAVVSESISVSISSSLSLSSTLVSQGDDSILLSETTSDIQSKSYEIEYSDVTVLKSEQKGKLYTLLVQINRETLFNNYHRKLERLDGELDTLYTHYQGQSKFDKLQSSVKIEEKLKEIEALLPILHAINTHYNSSKKMKKYTHYTSSIQKDFKNLSFQIKADKNSQNLATLIKNELNKKDISYKIKNSDLIMQINTRAKKRRYKSTNANFAKLIFALRITTIQIYDASGTLLHTTTHKTKDASPHSFEDAINKNAKYKKIIAKMGIIPFLLK